MEMVEILERVEFSDAKPSAKTLLTGNGARVVLFCMRKGQKVPEHAAPGFIFVQLVSGWCTFYDGAAPAEMKAGTLLRLPSGRPHRLEAHDDSVVLVTILDAQAA
jgi:quercetin dioxygenase-like cupin family protein